MTLWFGGDYNPEQWPEAVWDEDVRLMQRAGVTVATIGVFSWAKLEPEEGRFEFGWFDDVIDRLHAGGIRVDLATATASPPPWMVRAHPDILPVTADGVRLSGGSRQHYSPHSATYRHFAARLVRRLAERYGSHPALIAWHVNNEYGCHVSRSYDNESATGFRAWLRNRYGTIDRLNAAWGTTFWSQQYAVFDEIDPPRAAPADVNPTQLIDFDRFSSDALLGLFTMEAEILREVSPGVPVTTNFMGAFKPVNYWSWAPHVDFVSDDNYPDPADPDAAMDAALTRDLMRSLSGGKPWILMEQATSAVNWREHNAPKSPGMNRAFSMQAVSRGADGIMYFQWRQSTSGSEKFHSAMLPHAGPETRVFREVEALGNELGGMNWIEGTPVDAHVAILVDWDSWWAIEQHATPTAIDYSAIVSEWHRALWRATITVDFVQPGSDLSAYSAVIAPSLYVLSDAAAATIDAYVRNGGTFVATFQTGILDPNLRISAGGYLGGLRDTLGIEIEEFAPLAGPAPQRAGAPISPKVITGEDLGVMNVSLWSEYLHVRAATVVARFDEGDVAGWPAITVNHAGSGAAWYVASRLDADAIDRVLKHVLGGTAVRPILDEAADGVEAVRRGEAVFVINHRAEARTVLIGGVSHEISPRDVLIIRDSTVS